MSLDENNYKEQINAFTPQDWQPLIELIPKIISTSRFGKWAGGEENKEGVFTFPYMVESSIVLEFFEIVYEMPIIINFDWVDWNEGREIANNESFNLDTLDLPTKCKLITAIVRNDKFCDGALVSAFESGLILRILKSIKKQIVKSIKKQIADAK